MKTRILTTAIGLPIVFFGLFCYNSIILSILVGALSCIAVYEMLESTKYVRFRALTVIGMAQAFVTAFLCYEQVKAVLPLLVMLEALLFLVLLFTKREEVKFSEIAITCFVSLIVPYALSCLVFLRDVITGVGPYFILMAFACAWLCDASAYFVGRAYGKRKLAPNISPNKTVEGAVGGVVICVAINILITYGYMFVVSATQDITVQVHFFNMILVFVLAAIVGIFGDLTASIIKRQRGLKDFGHLFPGHGGVMDRFDSVLFITPFLYTIVAYLPIISIK